jgi:hypothetical protein
MGKKNKCFIEFAKGHKQIGRVVFEMYSDLAPSTVDFFIELLTAKSRGYLGTILSRVVIDGYLIGGDLKEAHLTPQPNESFDRRHAHAGVLSLDGNSC